MTNNQLVSAVMNSNGAILALDNKSLSPAHAYKVIKLRNTLKKAWEKFLESEKGLLTEVGITDAAAFDARQKELGEKENKSKEEETELKEMNEKVARYAGLREALLEDQADFSEVKAMPYEEWFALKKDNPAISIEVEDALMNIAWTEPAE